MKTKLEPLEDEEITEINRMSQYFLDNHLAGSKRVQRNLMQMALDEIEERK